MKIKEYYFLMLQNKQLESEINKIKYIFIIEVKFGL